MTFAQFVAVLAPCSMLLQILLMGVIGYPIARRRPGGMEAFRRSGFLWWMVTLIGVSILGFLAIEGAKVWYFPSRHGASIGRLLVASIVGVLLCLLVELSAERLSLIGGDLHAREAANARYEGALPTWGRDGAGQYVILGLVALLEEFVFRSLALGGLLDAWDLPKVVAAGLVAAAFGLSHWYYGGTQVLLKTVIGSVLVWAALTGGWLSAALAHVVLNLVLTAISDSRARSSGRRVSNTIPR